MPTPQYADGGLHQWRQPDASVRQRGSGARAETARVVLREGATMSAKDVVEKAYQAVGAGDIPTFLGLLDDEVEWTEAAGWPYTGAYHGPQATLENVFAQLANEWDGFN